MSVKNYHIDPNWLLLLLVSVAIISSLYGYSTILDLESIKEVSSTEIGAVASDEVYIETGFVGPLMESSINEIEKEETPEIIVENPPFDSIRPFPNSHLPDHIDSMWFHVSNELEWTETLDSISLIVKGKEMTLRPNENVHFFFNSIRENPLHNVSFQDLNQNGYDDIKVTLGISGATGNLLFDVFIYSDIDTTYLYNREFSSYANIRIDKDGLYHSSSKGGWGNYHGKIMQLDVIDGKYYLTPFVTYRQRWYPDENSTDFHHIMNFKLNGKEINYVDTFPDHLRKFDYSHFPSIGQMRDQVKYYQPKITCTHPTDTDNEAKICSLSFLSRLNDHEIYLMLDLENMQVEISDKDTLKPIILDMIFTSKDEDFEPTPAYLASTFSFYENWRSPPELHLLIRSANIELVDEESEWNYSFNKPLRVW